MKIHILIFAKKSQKHQKHKSIEVFASGAHFMRSTKIENEPVWTAYIKYNYPILARIKLVSMKIHILIFEKKVKIHQKHKSIGFLGLRDLFGNVRKNEKPPVPRGGSLGISSYDLY